MLRIAGKAQVYLGETETAQAKPLTRLAGGVDEYVLSPDGRRLALLGTGASGKQIWLLELKGDGEPVPLTSGLAEAESLLWHPDGRRIFFLKTEVRFPTAAAATPSVVRWKDESPSPRHIRSVDVETKQERPWTQAPDYIVLNFEIAADGRNLAFQAQSSERPVIPNDHRKSTLRLLNLENTAARILVPQMGGPGQCTYAFSPDGRKLAYVSPDRLEYARFGKLHILDLTDGRIQNPMEKRTSAWNPFFGVNPPTVSS